MTAKEAIKQLQTEHDLIAQEYDLDGSQFAPAFLEALAMAIEALKAQDMTLYMNLPEVSAEEAVEILKRNNRIELIPSGEDTNVPNTDTISRQATITEIKNYERDSTAPIDYVKIVEQMPPAQPDARYINANELIKRLQQAGLDDAVSIAVKMAGHERLKHVPSAQHERDIPIKPSETTDKAWGIPSRQAVCPKCDYYLGHIAFLDCYKGKRITYCETCGQAIDWEGWKFDG